MNFKMRVFFFKTEGVAEELMEQLSREYRVKADQIPPAYPVRLPLEPTTRWQGMIMEMALCPTAPPTAWADIWSFPNLAATF